jgi:NtrC-family two-component system sensor histidine kinase KinB
MMMDSSQEKPLLGEDRTRALLELLYHVSREVATALDLRTVLQRVLFEATQNIGGQRGSIVVLDDNGKPIDSTIVYGKTFHQDTTQQLRDTVERGLAGWVVRNRKPALIPDTSLDDRWLRRPDDALDRTGPKSAICVPLLAREKLVGVLTLVHPQANAFGMEHLELMQAIADQAGIAVLNARLYTESQRQARVMTALAEGAAAINTSLRLDEVLQRILNQSMQALQVETVALALADPTSGDMVFRAATGQNAGNVLGRRVPAGRGLIGQVVSDGHGVVVPAVSKDMRFKSEDRFGGIETRTIAVAPIKAQGKVIGVLEAINPVSGTFDPDALLVLNGIGSMAGTNIQNAQLFEKLEVAHQRYRELFETSIDPILITDWEGNILEANRKASEVSLYLDEELRTMNVNQVHEVDFKKTGEKFEHITEYQPCVYQSLFHKKDGHIIHVQVNVRPVNFEDADVLQWTLHDVSERKALDDLRNDLIAMVYHDLRSPLANIISSLDILSGLVNAEDNETIQSILAVATNSTTRIERLVNSLLDINRLESGQRIVNQNVVNLESLIAGAVKEVQPMAESRRQAVTSLVLDNLSPVWVDKDMILRVLLNLLENAAKFTPAGGKVAVDASEEDGWIIVSIEDNGPGIPILDRERIFDKFTRLRGQHKPGGLGIGLAFCKIAVEGHGGKIWVESQNNVGTTFFFTLPVATKQQQIDAQGD